MNPSSSAPPWLISAAAVALTALTAYVVYGPNDNKKMRRRRNGSSHPPGLNNLGNSCFVNAILQALASSPSFVSWLESRCREGDEDTVLVALKNTLRHLAGSKGSEASGSATGSVESALPVLNALRRHGWKIDRDEQDAHEMLQVLLTSIEEELDKRGDGDHRSILLLSDEEESEGDAGSPTTAAKVPGSKFGHRRTNSSGVFSRCGSVELSVENVRRQTCRRSSSSATPFSGTVTSKVTYGDGRAKSPTASATFNNVTLTLPSSAAFSSVSLATLVQMYISRERVDADVGKQFTFGRLPRCLCFHVQRTSYERGLPRKRTDRVEFEPTLDMGRYVYVSQIMRERRISAITAGDSPGAAVASPAVGAATAPTIPYRLCSVVEHLGAINSGHYVTYRRCDDNDRWFLASDDCVEEVALGQVLKANAYMLFYEKA